MIPGGGGRPTWDLLGPIERDFGSFGKFLAELKTGAATQFVPQEITGGKGVDVAVEALGKPQEFAQCTRSVKDGGKAVMIGLAQGGSLGQVDIKRLVRRKVCTLDIYLTLVIIITTCAPAYNCYLHSA